MTRFATLLLPIAAALLFAPPRPSVAEVVRLEITSKESYGTFQPGVGIVKEEHYKADTTKGGTAGEREVAWSRELVRYTAVPASEESAVPATPGRRVR